MQGPGEINPRILNECSESIAEPLKILLTKSLEEGKLPPKCKKAHVTPIFKAGNRKNAENYRPIIVTSICCRTIEKLIRDEIVNHLEHNQIISKNQHGFRKGYSCATQLLTCIEEWTNAIDQGHDVDVIYFDFKAAFDKVPQKRLL